MKRKKEQKKSNSKCICVGMIGLGTVGRGVAKILTRKHESLLKKTGFDFKLKKICVRHKNKKRSRVYGAAKVTTRIGDILDDPQIDQVVELMGGIQPAQQYIQRALKGGKDVISANKALFAEKGAQIYTLAQQLGRHIGLEASVGGGMPVIKSFKESLAANHIDSFYGILNGTCNAVLTDMSQRGMQFQDALQDAKKKGYAEADPTMDIDGTDTAHKLAILCRIAFQRKINFKDIARVGIEQISPLDIRYAHDMGYVIKLIAIAKRKGNVLEARVHPTLLPLAHPLAKVDGVNNAIWAHTDEAGEILILGKGAGEKPTASAVVSDMIDLAKLRQTGAHAPKLSFPKAKIRPLKNIQSRHYLRMELPDKTGALGNITQILARYSISIASVHQLEGECHGFAPVMLLTHSTTRHRLLAAVAAIERTPLIRRKTVVIAVEEA